MNYLKKLAVMILGAFPLWLHGCVTGPALWSHNSSAAFDAWVFLWVVSIGGFIYACLYSPKEREPQGDGS